MSKFWINERPAVFDCELKAFKDLEIEFEIEDTLKAAGLLQVKFKIEPGNAHFNDAKLETALDLIVVYPDSYPFYRPQIFAPGLNLSRHQNPIEKNLCLIGRSTIEWNSSLTASQLLKQQLPQLLEKGIVTDYETVKNDPAEQAEPISEYFALAENPVLFDPSIFPEEDLQDNTFNLLATVKFAVEKSERFPSRIAVLESSITSTGKLIKTPLDFLQNNFPTTIYGQVYKTSEPPPSNPAEMLNWLREKVVATGKKFTPKYLTIKIGNKIILHSVTGLCFPEEKEKGVWGYGWLFHFEATIQPKDANGNKLRSKKFFRYLRGADIRPLSMNLRAPKLAPLADKTVSIAGIGALGSFIAIELARSGVNTLNLLDHDSVEAATTIRWPLGLPAVGLNKGVVLKEFIETNYPGKTVQPFPWLIGTFRRPDENNKILLPPEPEVLDKFLRNCSLIIDASTEFGVHHHLSRLAQENGIPYISLFATAGAYGGSIMRQIPNQTGCWSCFTHMEADGSVLKLNADPVGLIQPPGCGDITFTGASVDLQQISLMATKLAISTLCNGQEDGYPTVDWDIARVNLFGENGEFQVPEWCTSPLPVHKDCHYCN